MRLQPTRKAVAKGLQYKGFGYWADSSGQIVARSHGDKLEPVGCKKEEEEEKKEEQPGGASSFGQMMDMGAQQQAPAVQGEVKPGEEKARKEKGEGSWEPGPNGDTSVGNPEEVADDAFVTKTNDSKWTAGYDGDNYKNFSFDKFKAEAVQVTEDTETPAQKASRLNLTSDGHGRWFDAQENSGFTRGGDLVPASDKEKRDHEDP